MRYPSVDILRTVAIIVMVMVHFPENLSNYVPPFAGLGAPLFTFLSGVSYYLWASAQQRRKVPDEEISKISIRRGLFVIGVGFAFNVLVWMPEDTFIWDVLTFIGVAILILNQLRHQPLPVLLTIAVTAVALSPALRVSADWDAYWINGYYESDFTLIELIAGFLATGYFPLFPWIAYSLVGFSVASLLFPQDRESKPSVWPFVGAGIGLLAMALTARVLRSFAAEAVVEHLLTGWTMMPPSVEYICTTIGSSLILLSLLHQYVDRTVQVESVPRVFLLVKVFSRYAFTIYIVHHIVHLYPLWIYGLINNSDPTSVWRDAMPVAVSMPLGGLFLICCYFTLRRIDPDSRFGIEGWMRWLCG